MHVENLTVLLSWHFLATEFFTDTYLCAKYCQTIIWSRNNFVERRIAVIRHRTYRTLLERELMRFPRRCIRRLRVAVVTEAAAIHDATERRQMHVQQQFHRRFLDRNCRHRRLINITSIVAFLHSPKALPASNRKASIIIHSSLNRPPTRQLRLPVGRKYTVHTDYAFLQCKLVLRCINVCSGDIISLEKRHSQITSLQA